MALVALASAKGSPGVTTAALALGALWPRPVVVAECDTAGSDLAVRTPAADGGVLDADRGLLTLAAAGRRGLRSELVPAHTQQALGGLDVLVGLRTSEQAAGVGTMWPQLGSVFDDLEGYDVIADLGRCGAQTPQAALLRSARLAILVCTAEPSSVVHLRERATVLAADLDSDSPHGVPLAVLVVADLRRRREAVREVFAAVEQLEVPIAHTWQLAWDPRGAKVFAGVVDGRPDRTALVRSARQVTEEVARVVAPFFVQAPPADAVGSTETTDDPDDAGSAATAHGVPREPGPEIEPQPWQQPAEAPAEETAERSVGVHRGSH